jgi:hypothetical protein
METLTFEIFWLDCAGFPNETPRPRIIGRDTVRRKDLTAAITAACGMLKKGKGNSSYAHGFTVRVRKGDNV